MLCVRNSVFTNSSATEGGEIAATICNSAYSNNSTVYYGDAYMALPGTSSISNSVFRNNSAGIGGRAIEVRSVPNVSCSAILTNSESSAGRAISNPSRGTTEVTETLTVTNSTFANHSATNGSATATGNHGVGLDIGNAEATLTHTSVSNNSDGSDIYNEDALRIYNSIINGNIASDCAGTLIANTRNIIGTGACSAAFSTSNPLLGSLTGNPAYFPLLYGSPAINAVDASRCPARDQSGASRPAGDACDTGAYEFGGSTTQLQPTRVVSNEETVQHSE